MHRFKLPHRNTGFSLVELAIVLVIVALLTSGLLLGISAQRNAAENIDAQRQMETIREALTGFALTRGRLPCPAQPGLANTDANAGIENCAQQHGVLPWVTLGLPETDPWGNRFTYFASSKFTAALAAGTQASFTLLTGDPPDNAGRRTSRPAAAAPATLHPTCRLSSSATAAAGPAPGSRTARNWRAPPATSWKMPTPT